MRSSRLFQYLSETEQNQLLNKLDNHELISIIISCPAGGVSAFCEAQDPHLLEFNNGRHIHLDHIQGTKNEGRVPLLLISDQINEQLKALIPQIYIVRDQKNMRSHPVIARRKKVYTKEQIAIFQAQSVQK